MKDSCRDVYCEAVTNILVFFTSSSFSSFESEKYGFLVSPRSQKYTYCDSGNRVYLVLVQSPSTLEVLCFDLFYDFLSLLITHRSRFMLDARRGRFLLCSLDRTHTQEVGLSELITGLIRFEDFMSETRQGQILLLVTEIRFGGGRFESHVSFLVSGQASNRLSSRDARKRWPLRFMMEGRVLLPESDLSG